jgi:hypothetical protein
MKTTNGEDFAKAIEQFTAQQTSQAQSSYSMLIARLVGAFTIKYQIPVQSGAVSAISRILKKLDDEGIRQVRAMSDSLLQVEDKELLAELEELQAQLLPMSAQTHQVKTRSAFINTVLRPFDFKYAKRWLTERRDINTDSVRERIEDLERRKLGTSEEVSRWADDVLNLFNDVVIYWGDEADQYYLRPAGTISPKSSRTYVQAWVAFIDKFGPQVLESAISGPNDYESKTLYSVAPPPDYEVGLGQSVPPDMFSNLNAIVSEETLSLSDRDAKTSRRVKTDSISAPRAKAAWVKVLIESRANESAQATRKWDSLNAFQESLGAWLNSVERIWGPLARELSIKVSVKTRDGETELTIPSVKISEAEEVALQTANLLQNN